MKVELRALLAMLGGFVLASSSAPAQAQAPGQIPAGVAYYNYDSEAGGLDAAGHATAGPCGCGDSPCGGGCVFSGGLGGLAARRGQVFAGADWLNLRASVSDATAFVERDAENAIDTFHQANFSYNSSYRLFGGYRFNDCCGEVLFSYARYRSEGSLDSGASTATRQFNAPFEVNAITPGSEISTDIDVDARVFDIDFGRVLPLGSALGDCGCTWCPAWDIKWFFGARYADVEWTRDSVSTDTAAQTVNARTRMDFHGAGPRFGVDGRRYIGRNGNFSVFARGAISVLVGDVDYVTTGVTVTPGVVPTQVARFKRVIPVADIELGGSVHVSDNITVSGGYLLSAWHDLGMGDQYFAALTPIIYDDANILGFDGFFVRAEVAY